ncbi:MAG: hypothetical protein NTY64_02125, partial [Deltaproteobacteria bacterium]|nr:hypothetical protein [Deltaproteobacteria bacterium]
MPRVLTVSEVRKAVYLAAGGLKSPGPGEASTALLGYLFHETFRRLTGPDPQCNLVRPLERADRNPASWEQQLIQHTYLWCVGPQLARYQTDLRGSTNPVLPVRIEKLSLAFQLIIGEDKTAHFFNGLSGLDLFQKYTAEPLAEVLHC